jgi:hypothetical protein
MRAPGRAAEVQPGGGGSGDEDAPEARPGDAAEVRRGSGNAAEARRAARGTRPRRRAARGTRPRRRAAARTAPGRGATRHSSERATRRAPRCAASAEVRGGGCVRRAGETRAELRGTGCAAPDATSETELSEAGGPTRGGAWRGRARETERGGGTSATSQVSGPGLDARDAVRGAGRDDRDRASEADGPTRGGAPASDGNGQVSQADGPAREARRGRARKIGRLTRSTRPRSTRERPDGKMESQRTRRGSSHSLD